MAIYLSFCSPKGVNALELAKETIKQAQAYNVDAKLIAQIVIVESSCIELAWNATSNDNGLMQISSRLARHKKLTGECLYSWKCNLEVGTAYIAELKRSKNFKPCMYNTGATGAKKWPKACAAYEQKLAKYNKHTITLEAHNE